jgi:hypothetical protein
MPGTATHMVIADIINNTLDINIGDEKKIKEIIEGNEDYFKMGSLGPDMLFFAPDYNDDVHQMLEQIVDFYEKIIEPAEEVYDKYIEPIVNAINRGINDLDKSMFCGTFEELGNEIDSTLERLSQIKSNLLLIGTTQMVNVFDMIRPEIQLGKDETTWYWFDMLHYRKTGSFAKKMWDNCSTNEERSYVLGYITHIAADITGHPYVNTAVGGPARSHNQRHHFVENMIDTWVYDNLQNRRFTNAKIHRELPSGDLFDTDESILRTLFRNADTIPDNLVGIFNMMNRSLEETFHNDIHPRRLESEYLTAEDFNFAYLTMLASLKSVSSSYIPKPAAPTEDMLDTINEVMNAFLEHASNPPTHSGGFSGVCSPFSNDCHFSMDALRDFAESVWENIVYLGELIAWVGQLLRDIYNLISCTLTAPIKIVIKALFWIIQSALYAITEDIRQVLVLSALVPPEKEWLNANPIAQTCVNIVNRSPDDGLLYGKYYPHQAQESNNGFLYYPTTSPEDHPTMPGPYGYGSTPKDFIINAQSNDALYERYANARTPEETVEIASRESLQPIGSSVDVAKDLMISILRGEDIPNWNLDADRGFAFKTWRLEAPDGVNPLAPGSNYPIKAFYI